MKKSNNVDLSHGNGSWENTETSFERILNRTRQNIDKVNKRYATSNDDNTVTRNILSQNHASNIINKNSNNLYQHEKKNIMKSNHIIVENIDESNITIPSSTLTNILDRLSNMESNSKNYEELFQSNIINTKRIEHLEESNKALRDTVENLVLDLKDSQRNISQLQLQLNRHSNSIETLQLDGDNRKSVISKLDIVSRQGEAWRDEVETKIDHIYKQFKGFEKKGKDQMEDLNDRATKADLELFRDKTTSFVQQTVAVTLSVWHDRIEDNLKTVERQLQEVQLGRQLNNDSNMNDIAGNNDINGKNTKITSILPSELLLKGLVNTAVRQVESDLEEKVGARVRGAMRAEVADSSKVIRTELKDYLSKLAAELGIVNPDDTSDDVSPAMKIIKAKKEAEKGMNHVLEKIEDLSIACIALSERGEDNDKNLRNELRIIERKMDETSNIANNSMTQVTKRCSGLEDYVRGTEVAMRTLNNQMRDEMIHKLSESSELWTEDKQGMDRRIRVLERISEDIAERVKLSTSTIDLYFASSPQIKKFETIASRVDMLQVELKTLRTEERETSNVVTKLDATAARKSELDQIKDRLKDVEPVLQRVALIEPIVQTVTNNIAELKRNHKNIEAITTINTTESRSNSDRLLTIDVELKNIVSQVAKISDKKHNHETALNQLDSWCKAEINTLKDFSSTHGIQLNDIIGRMGLVEVTSRAELSNSSTKLSRFEFKIQEFEVASNHSNKNINHIIKTIEVLKESIRKVTTSIINSEKAADVARELAAESAMKAIRETTSVQTSPNRNASTNRSTHTSPIKSQTTTDTNDGDNSVSSFVYESSISSNKSNLASLIKSQSTTHIKSPSTIESNKTKENSVDAIPFIMSSPVADKTMDNNFNESTNIEEIELFKYGDTSLTGGDTDDSVSEFVQSITNDINNDENQIVKEQNQHKHENSDDIISIDELDDEDLSLMMGENFNEIEIDKVKQEKLERNENDVDSFIEINESSECFKDKINESTNHSTIETLNDDVDDDKSNVSVDSSINNWEDGNQNDSSKIDLDFSQLSMNIEEQEEEEEEKKNQVEDKIKDQDQKEFNDQDEKDQDEEEYKEDQYDKQDDECFAVNQTEEDQEKDIIQQNKVDGNEKSIDIVQQETIEVTKEEKEQEIINKVNNTKTSKSKNITLRYKCLYDFEAENEIELTVSYDEIVEACIDENGDENEDYAGADWIYVRSGSSLTGYVPNNYIEEIIDAGDDQYNQLDEQDEGENQDIRIDDDDNDDDDDDDNDDGDNDNDDNVDDDDNNSTSINVDEIINVDDDQYNQLDEQDEGENQDIRIDDDDDDDNDDDGDNDDDDDDDGDNDDDDDDNNSTSINVDEDVMSFDSPNQSPSNLSTSLSIPFLSAQSSPVKPLTSLNLIANNIPIQTNVSVNSTPKARPIIPMLLLTPRVDLLADREDGEKSRRSDRSSISERIERNESLNNSMNSQSFSTEESPIKLNQSDHKSIAEISSPTTALPISTSISTKEIIHQNQLDNKSLSTPTKSISTTLSAKAASFVPSSPPLFNQATTSISPSPSPAQSQSVNTGPPLSIKERLRLRQEQMKIEKEKEKQAAIVLNNSNSSGDEVMNFESFDDSFDA